MPFGLKNAPATFQHVLDIILSSIKWQFALVYLDDIVIFSRTSRQHINHTRLILSLLKDVGVTLKLKKCAFLTNKIDYLGHVIRPGRLEVASHTTDAIRDLKVPSTQTELRSFIGLCNLFLRFVPNFARIASPLTVRLRKTQAKELGRLSEEELTALRTLQEKLISPPILALPRKEGRYTLDTDAYDRPIGFVLLQKQDDNVDKPIGYWSKILNDRERNCDTAHRDCLAVVWPVLLLCPYLEGAHFTVRTDHHALKWILNLADATGKFARWRLRLIEYDCDIVHRAGFKHQAAEALSRLPTTGTDESDIKYDIPIMAVATHAQKRLNETNDDTPKETLIKKTEPQLLTLDEFIVAQCTDAYCDKIRPTVGLPGSSFTFDKQGLLARQSPIDGAVQKVVP